MTNNNWHNSFSALINCTKSVIWKFINALKKKDHGLTEMLKKKLLARCEKYVYTKYKYLFMYKKRVMTLL